MGNNQFAILIIFLITVAIIILITWQIRKKDNSNSYRSYTKKKKENFPAILNDLRSGKYRMMILEASVYEKGEEEINSKGEIVFGLNTYWVYLGIKLKTESFETSYIIDAEDRKKAIQMAQVKFQNDIFSGSNKIWESYLNLPAPIKHV